MIEPTYYGECAGCGAEHVRVCNDCAQCEDCCDCGHEEDYEDDFKQ